MKALPPRNADELRAITAMLAACVTDSGSRATLPIERECVAAIGRYVLDAEIDLASSDGRASPQLARDLPDPAQRLFTLRLCMLLGLVGDGLRREHLDNLQHLAGLLDCDIDDEMGLLRLAFAGRYKWLLLQITRRAASDYWGKGGRPGLRGWLEVLEQGFFIGKIRRPKVTARYQALADAAPGSLGREIFEFYRGHGYALPGEKGGMPEHFMLHECSHILSGYDTDPHGEMLVAAFTAGGKKRHVMDWVFVALLQWHLGASVGSFTVDVSHRGLLHPASFFHAWARGMGMNLSLMDDPWNWWDVIEVPVTELRQRYGIAPLRVVPEKVAEATALQTA